MAKKLGNHGAPWTKKDVATLRAFSRAGVPIKKVQREMGRSIAALRNRATVLGIGLGHQQRA